MSTAQIDEDKIYRLKEASELVGLSPSSIRRRIKSGEIKKMSNEYEKIRIWGRELVKLTQNKD